MYMVYTSRFSYNCGKLFPVSRNLNSNHWNNMRLTQIVKGFINFADLKIMIGSKKFSPYESLNLVFMINSVILKN